MATKYGIDLNPETFRKIVQYLVDEGKISFGDIAQNLNLQIATIKKIYLGRRTVKNLKVHCKLVNFFLAAEIPK